MEKSAQLQGQAVQTLYPPLTSFSELPAEHPPSTEATDAPGWTPQSFLEMKVVCLVSQKKKTRHFIHLLLKQFMRAQPHGALNTNHLQELTTRCISPEQVPGREGKQKLQASDSLWRKSSCWALT